jgi:isoleucyl-tRNA synthetase
VKEVVVADDMAAYGGFQLVPNSPVLGPKLGADMKKVMTAARSGDWQANPDGSANVGGVRLEPGEFQLRLVPKDGVTSAPLSTNDAVVVLDTAVTPELEREGLARDLVRLIQQARKDAGLHVSDRIALWFEFGELGRAAFAEHRSFVLEQVLGASVDAGAAPGHAFRAEGTLGSESVVLRLAKV